MKLDPIDTLNALREKLTELKLAQRPPQSQRGRHSMQIERGMEIADALIGREIAQYRKRALAAPPAAPRADSEPAGTCEEVASEETGYFVCGNPLPCSAHPGAK